MSNPEPVPAPRCYEHPDRPAGSVCRRCDRPICPECMHEAPVGWQCTGCLKQGARISPTVRWRPRQAGRLGNTRVTPVVAAIIAINVVVFVWEETNLDHNIERFGLWPNGVHYLHQWYRLMTAAFLHASFEHILFNMITLAIIGPPVEAELGRVRFGALYLTAALGGSVCSYLISPANDVGVGASGAIFGIMGAYFVLARRNRWDTSTILGLIVINLVISFADTSIDWRAHIGGLITGAAVGFGLHKAAELRRSINRGVEIAWGAAVVGVAVGPLVLLSLLPPGHFNV
jgi:membrane associated rhomboid family serine protease